LRTRRHRGPRRTLLVGARPERLRSHDAQRRDLQRCEDPGAGNDCALDRATERALVPRNRLGYALRAEQCRRLLLAPLVRSHRVHRDQHLDGPRARAVRDPADEPRQPDAQQLTARPAAPRRRRRRTERRARRATAPAAAVARQAGARPRVRPGTAPLRQSSSHSSAHAPPTSSSSSTSVGSCTMSSSPEIMPPVPSASSAPAPFSSVSMSAYSDAAPTRLPTSSQVPAKMPHENTVSGSAPAISMSALNATVFAVTTTSPVMPSYSP